MWLTRTVVQPFERHGGRRAAPLLRWFRRVSASQNVRLRQVSKSWSGWWAAGNYATVSVANLEFGQPVPETHAHILKPGEITPGITAREYANRRTALAGLMTEGSIAILPAAAIKYRSGPVFYAFRQESNFLYLTGFLEPESLAVIRKIGPSREDHVFHLFCRPKDPEAEQWSGPWSGLHAAEDLFKADESENIMNLDALRPLLETANRVYTDLTTGDESQLHAQIHSILKNYLILPLRPLVNRLRAIKSPAEIVNMRMAGQLSGRVITQAMRRPWRDEKYLNSRLEYDFVRYGLDGPAYIPVVAGGRRGRLIHYTQNNAQFDPDDMILVDAGGELGLYATDITRTWPNSGEFSPAQRDLYEAVLTAQRAAVALCRANSGLTLDGIHRVTERMLGDELARLGFPITKDGPGLRTLQQLFPHHVGHYLGLDVHDTPGLPRNIPLEVGHVVTVEPGVYVPDDSRFPEHFRGMAVRIEDSVCVQETGPLVLTTEAVKEVADIEANRI